jgi:hypothetical protein
MVPMVPTLPAAAKGNARIGSKSPRSSQGAGRRAAVCLALAIIHIMRTAKWGPLPAIR